MGWHSEAVDEHVGRIGVLLDLTQRAFRDLRKDEGVWTGEESEQPLLVALSRTERRVADANYLFTQARSQLLER